MYLNQENLTYCISRIIFILIAIQAAQTLSVFTDVPPPPTRPEHFRTREELKRYLQLVHEYYAIIGRPRFGRSLSKLRINDDNQHLFNFFDLNGDKSITYDEFQQRLDMK